MGEEHSRRRVLSAGLAVAGFRPVVGRSVGSGAEPSNTIEIESNSGGVAAYEFTVNGSLQQEDWDDQVTGNRAYGHVGPKRGTDTFSYSGELTGFVLAGPATAYRNGNQLDARNYPAPEGALRASDFPSRSGTSQLEIESDGGGFAVYEFDVSGSVAQVDDDDHVTGNHVYGHVGPKRGTDVFEFTGEITRFDVAGPATVYLDGSEVTPSGGTEPRVVRMSPQRKVTATPGTLLLFEAVAYGYPGEYALGNWYVNGQRWAGPSAFYGHLSGGGRSAFTHSFDEPGTHHVRAELYDESEGSDADPLGSVQWRVRVESEGNQPPTVERVQPASQTIEASSGSAERQKFVVRARDPEGALDRVVWWISQCDDVVGISQVSGREDAAALLYAPDVGCPLGARAIDRNGAVSGLEGWAVE